MAADLIIRPINTPKERREFICSWWRIYANDPHWVPPLISEREAFLDPKRNPFYEHADVALFMAERGGQPVGTIAALINHRHNEYHEEKTGFFGFFETIQDYSVAEGLLNTARDWVKARGMERLRGPANYSTNEECGLLVDGFDSPPVVLMTYNPRYYVDFLERYGMVKAMDLFAYHVDKSLLGPKGEFPPRLVKLVERVKERGHVTVRKIDRKHLDQEVERIKALYNAAWSRNWGFVPMTDAEIDHLAEGLKQIADFDIVFIAEANGEPIGFSLTLPDMHEVLYHLRDGRLFPTGWLKFLWYRRKITRVRIFALGVLEKYRGTGGDILLYYETAKAALEKGYSRAEMGWVLECNDLMNRVVVNLGGKRYKTYRFYEMPV
jgi:GNAT superfamily N-acetyltransferase